MPEQRKKNEEEIAKRNKKKIKVYVAHVSQAGADTMGRRARGVWGFLGRLP